MTDNQKQLRRELRAVGASPEEAGQLLPIAAHLNILKHHNEPVKMNHFGTKGWRGVLRPAAYTVLGVALGMFLIVSSQAALPGSALFPIQKASDNVAMDIHPQYRAMIMMKRARQVNELVAHHAASPAVLATLADYTRVADAYKSMPHASYAAFEYCESNLKDASAGASPTVQRAITNSLQSLEAS